MRRYGGKSVTVLVEEATRYCSMRSLQPSNPPNVLEQDIENFV